MRNKMKLATMMAMTAAMTGDMNHESTAKYSMQELEDRKADFEAKELERMLAQGLNRYSYNGNVIYARNQKNADRKAKNAGYL